MTRELDKIDTYIKAVWCCKICNAFFPCDFICHLFFGLLRFEFA